MAKPTDFERIVQPDPNYSDAHAGLGDIARRKKNFEEAAESTAALKRLGATP